MTKAPFNLTDTQPQISSASKFTGTAGIGTKNQPKEPTRNTKKMPLRHKKLVEADLSDFKRCVKKADASYGSLSSLRSSLRKQDEMTADVAAKIRYVEVRMRKLNKGKDGEQATRKRRVPGTGTLVEREVEYKDTAANRRANLVGQKYTVREYDNAEYVRVPRKMRKISAARASNLGGEDKAPRKKSLWIEAMQIAKKELGLPAFTIVRKQVTDENDEDQKNGHLLYVKAKEIMAELKEQQQKDQAKEKEVTPEPAEADGADESKGSASDDMQDDSE